VSKPRKTAPHDVTTAPHDVDLSHVRWRKSSYSGAANDCVEIADLTETAHTSDSRQQGPAGACADRSLGLVRGVHPRHRSRLTRRMTALRLAAVKSRPR
jgi:hypothetical protein